MLLPALPLFLLHFSFSSFSRPLSLSVQNMGWNPSNKLWLTSRGGDLLFSPEDGVSENFDAVKFNSRGFGILDVGFKVRA
jgi:hypothetical protein